MIRVFDQKKIYKTMQWTFISFCLLVIAAVIVFPYPRTTLPDTRLDLFGQWKISCDDNDMFSRADYDDKAWDQIKLP